VRRGDVYLVNLDPVVGSEAGKARAAVVVSNDGSNSTAARLSRGVVTIVPVTSNTERIYSFQVHLPGGHGGLDRDSKAQAEQVRSVDVRRLVKRLGAITPDTVRHLDDALRLHLSL
jgi:mRNA interferase MazF